jgi:hypothetical protein
VYILKVIGANRSEIVKNTGEQNIKLDLKEVVLKIIHPSTFLELRNYELNTLQ